jgi:ferredoxin
MSTMQCRIITKKAFPEFVAGLARKAELWAPREADGKEYSRFSRIRSAKEISFRYVNTKLPVKELFFPQREVLFRFNSKDPSGVERTASGVERVVLGVRPCDAAALTLFDKVFLDPKLVDPYYAERRKKATLVGLACNAPADTCFCTALGMGPHSTRGLDLLLVDLGNRYLARPATEKGEKLVSACPEAKKADTDEADVLADKARDITEFGPANSDCVPSPPDMNKLAGQLEAAFEHEVWQELSLPCVNCGVCTYVCPTCHCFDVTDEEHHDQGARIRTWDSCQFSLFTKHASGHNPRPTGRDRMRQRTLHKFRYYPKTYGEVLCVGCGRCITECPAGIDLRETIETLRKALSESKEA